MPSQSSRAGGGAGDAGSANAQLLEWVKEWWDTARERNSKGVTAYKHAYDSLKACPIAFEHPSQLLQLKGFGPKLCERLTEKLREHCERNGLPMPSVPRKKKKRGAGSNPLTQGTGANDNNDSASGDDEGPARPAKRPRKPKLYVPQYRSGAYAIVVALSSISENGTVGLPKADLIEKAQPHCDASFSAPSDPTKFYTAWNSMKTLLTKELVYERGRPLKRYALTDEGWEVAKRIQQANAGGAGGEGSSNTGAGAGAGAGAGVDEDDTVGDARPITGGTRHATLPQASEHRNMSRMSAAPSAFLDEEADPDPPKAGGAEFQDLVADGDAVPDDSALPTFAPIRLMPGTFTVELVLDVREVRAKTDRDYMQEELAKQGAKPVMRSLELGDAMWVAKCNRPGWLARMGAEGDEVVLDWIVERKRLDDLISSIKDGRFKEQKFRLRKSGIRNVIYIVEEISMDVQQLQKYEEAVQSAMASIQVVDGYFLKQTQKMDETIRYLASVTQMLKKLYEGRPLHVIPTKVLTGKNYLPLLRHLRETQPNNSHHISYPAFASLASKSDLMTLRDLFLKMLMCTRGVTGEKAIEIQKVWKTPHELVKAYEACGTGEEGKKRKLNLVAAKLDHLVGRKKIPKVVSHKLAETWGDA